MYNGYKEHAPKCLGGNPDNKLGIEYSVNDFMAKETAKLDFPKARDLGVSDKPFENIVEKIKKAVNVRSEDVCYVLGEITTRIFHNSFEKGQKNLENIIEKVNADTEKAKECAEKFKVLSYLKQPRYS